VGTVFTSALTLAQSSQSDSSLQNGLPSLNKYAADPAKSIRISVQNGNVTLDGVVDIKADKDTANIR
jgi:osmotically-inducible protein OsmY